MRTRPIRHTNATISSDREIDQNQISRIRQRGIRIINRSESGKTLAVNGKVRALKRFAKQHDWFRVVLPAVFQRITPRPLKRYW